MPPRHDQQVPEIRAWVSDLIERRDVEGNSYLLLPEKTARNGDVPTKLTADQAFGIHSCDSRSGCTRARSRPRAASADRPSR